MDKKINLKKILIFFILFSAHSIFAWINPSVHVGIGLPKIPVNRISRRTPFSFTAGAELTIPILRRNIIQVHSDGLYTIDLGSAISGTNKDFKFNLLWAGIDFGYSVRNNPINRSSVMAGISRYYLSQVWEDSRDNLSTFGMCLGLSYLNKGIKHNTVFEIRWHLLFNPNPMPQVLTVVFGYAF
ncbi:hypothetical protein J7K93_00655 [bacterium]|nr:hypothetical protein [bacterium]